MEMFFDLGIERKKGEILISSIVKYDVQGIWKAENTEMKPVVFDISEGKELFDIVGYQDTANFAISVRLNNLLLGSEFNGWKSYPIIINDLDVKYYGFQVTGKCGKIDTPQKVGFYTGYKFDINTWDGSDFFSPDETALLFCTKEVQMFFKKHKITNAELIDINRVKSYSFGK